MKTLLIFLIVVLNYFQLNAQTKYESAAWLVGVNSTKINQNIGLTFDMQLLSADHLAYLKNFMFRAGFSYYITKQHSVTAGYFQNQTFSQNDVLPFPGAKPLKNPLLEHQIWEQYITTHQINGVFTMHRFRLEQRFIERNGGEDFFAQRFRYFIRMIKPLQKKKDTFKGGVFIALQNEVFLNVQNNKELNGSLFDQNRTYFALGYRFSPKFDIDAGYVKQIKHGVKNNTINNIGQLVLYTRF